jgi:DNA-binding response OmpR family regulator
VSEDSKGAPDPPWSASTRTLARSSDRGSAGTILVVDDDTAWLATLETWLAHDGFRVIGISRGEWVVQAVDFHEPDAVVLDIHLPGADGLDILGQLRRRQPDIPVIVMTAFGGFALEDRARRLGAAGYFDKPFRLSDLVTALRRVRRSQPPGQAL